MDFVRKLTLSWTTELFPSVPKPKILTLSKSTQITTDLPVLDPDEENSSRKDKEAAVSDSSDKRTAICIPRPVKNKNKKAASVKRKRAVVARAEDREGSPENGHDSGTTI
jgi:hypothetical protein